MSEESKARLHYSRRRHSRGSLWSDSGYVFTTSVGTPLDSSSVTKQLHRFLARAGLPDLTFHDLRHVFASLLVAGGESRVEPTLGFEPRTCCPTLGFEPRTCCLRNGQSRVLVFLSDSTRQLNGGNVRPVTQKTGTDFLGWTDTATFSWVHGVRP